MLLLGAGIIFRSVSSHALSAGSALKSGVTGYCLDDRHDSAAAGASVDLWKCNSTAAQSWTITGAAIVHDASRCLGVENNAKIADGIVVLSNCNDAPGQVWLRNQGGFENPNSGLCLEVSGDANNARIILASCEDPAQANELWTSGITGGKNNPQPPCGDTEGQKVACAAEREWVIWQSGTPDHETLLNQYTDGAPYEEWCADFVSYVYKEAGYPFTGGETDGWDENIAANIQNMDFTKHPAAGYVPRPGDVAYFDYDGGHVEIVVSGGTTPTFIYGNSDTIDPATGNGQMAANTITDDGAAGHAVYYLSPDRGY
jgi:hypothetical protein